VASVYDLKPRFQDVLRPIAHAAAGKGVSANAVTIAALVGSLAAGVLVALSGQYRMLLLVIPVWLFVRMALNAIDGMIAREFDQTSNVGAILNELGDVVSDTALYLPLAFAFPQAATQVVLFVIGAALTEFCGVLGSALGAKRHYEGPMGKSDRAVVVGTMALAIAVSASAVVALPWVLGAAALLTLLTCVNRLRGALGDLALADSSSEVTR